FNEGSHLRLYTLLGAQVRTVDGVPGTNFAVWAPGAGYVSVIGDFNGWSKASHPLYPRESSGIWEGFVPHVGPGTLYKYHVVSRYHGHWADKIDPLGFFFEVPPRTASIVWDLGYTWHDAEWLSARRLPNSLAAPMSIYEVHLGSWMRIPEQGDRWLGYR